MACLSTMTRCTPAESESLKLTVFGSPKIWSPIDASFWKENEVKEGLWCMDNHPLGVEENIRTYLTMYMYTQEKYDIVKKKTCTYIHVYIYINTILRFAPFRNVACFFKMEPWAWNIDIEENSQSCQCFRSR